LLSTHFSNHPRTIVIGNILLKSAMAGAVLALAAAQPAAAQSRKYDSEEVIKNTRTIDRSRDINTVTEVPVRRRTRETNHLVIHENETRNVGVIRHNRIIIEKEIRYVRRVPVVTPVYFVTRYYRLIEQPDFIEVPVVQRRMQSCRHRDSCGPIRVRD
jgi:hypothetical protein